MGAEEALNNELQSRLLEGVDGGGWMYSKKRAWTNCPLPPPP